MQLKRNRYDCAYANQHQRSLNQQYVNCDGQADNSQTTLPRPELPCFWRGEVEVHDYASLERFIRSRSSADKIGISALRCRPWSFRGSVPCISCSSETIAAFPDNLVAAAEIETFLPVPLTVSISTHSR